MEREPATTTEDIKEELQRVEEELGRDRRGFLWFLKPNVWRLRSQRDALRTEVKRLKEEKKAKPKPPKAAPAPAPAPSPPLALSSEGIAVHDATLIITVSEIGDRHGTGVLLERIFRPAPDFIHVRARNLYDGQTAGALRIGLPPGTVATANLPALLQGSTVRRILSIPFDRCDVENTLAFHDATRAPLCVWLMDHNLGEGEHQIPRPMMKQLLDRAQLRLGISPEFCKLYGSEFGHEVHFAPPVVDAALGQRTPLELPHEFLVPPTGVLLGNVWSQRWLKKLASTAAASGVPLVAFGHKAPPWVKQDALAAHVQTRGFLPEAELVAELRRHPFAVVPTGTLDAEDDLPEIARYSLPSRTLYLSAVGNLPIIVVGHHDTGVARFVTRHGLGVVVPHDGAALRRAAHEICRPDQQLHFRRQAAGLAPSFACDDMLQWLWKSLDIGAPSDNRWRHLSGTD
ncbi:hypothetical protein AYO49_04600 [Verrucomicrobiaceae bacterium SCGC AG-212-N21]|nr:hypothetical protein AYO49_04600 [Verrucomicrobiaceae bacterium SCGC AG-212-N21]